MPQNSNTILFDRFEILETLKKDQQTTVYLANHIYLGKKIILKTLSADELSDKTFLDRFKREAKILAQLDHKNVIKVLDFGTSENKFYISFEYFEGSDLRKIINENNLSIDDKINLCIQLFKALDAAHQRGIIHRDIKPENILVNSKLELKIADFGLASVRDENILTHKSSIVGTPGYMSPEQIRGEELTPLTDLFSSGIVIYELFTGENPLIGKDISATINNILNFKIERDFSKLHTLPGEIQNLLQELLRKNFTKRIKSAPDALEYFKRIQKTEEENRPVAIEKKSQKNKVIISLIIILFLSAATITLNFILKEDKDTTGISEEKTFQSTPELEDSVQEEPVETLIVQNELINKNEKEIINEAEVSQPLLNGKLFVEVSPWANVFLNGQNIGTTPLNSAIELKPGTYELKLIHPDFPDFIDSIEIKTEEEKTVKVNFYDEVGFLDCKIFPWGEIYINGEYKNTTPLRKPIVLLPGEYKIKIVNPGYSKEIDDVIIIKAKETIAVKYNFENYH